MNTTNLWKAQLVRGIFALIFALLLFIYPGITLLILVSFFGAFFAITGLFNIFTSFKIKKQNQPWRFLFIEGLLSFLFGCAVWLWPGLTSIILVYIFAAWLFITGILQLADAIRMSKFFKHTFWLGLLGLISIIFGIYIFANPGQGAIALITIIGIYAAIYAILAIVSAFALKKLNKTGSI